jgi:small-conductance mechanosensitive channel
MKIESENGERAGEKCRPRLRALIDDLKRTAIYIPFSCLINMNDPRVRALETPDLMLIHGIGFLLVITGVLSFILIRSGKNRISPLIWAILTVSGILAVGIGFALIIFGVGK